MGEREKVILHHHRHRDHDTDNYCERALEAIDTEIHKHLELVTGTIELTLRSVSMVHNHKMIYLQIRIPVN